MRVSGPREPSGQAWKQSFRVSGVQCPSKRLLLDGFLGVRVWIMYFSVSESFAAYKGRVSLRNEGTPLKAPRVGFRPPLRLARSLSRSAPAGGSTWTRP